MKPTIETAKGKNAFGPEHFNIELFIELLDLRQRVPENNEVVDDKEAEVYNEGCDYAKTSDYKIVAAEVERETGPVMGKKVLEVGQGPGNLMEELLKMGAAKVTGLDPSKVMTAYCNKKFARQVAKEKLSFVQGSVYGLPLEFREGFGLVVCMNTFHQFANPEGGLKGIVQAIAPGGAGLIRDFRRDISKEMLLKRARYTKPAIVPYLVDSIRAASTKEEFRMMLKKTPGIKYSVEDAVDPQGLSPLVDVAIKYDPVPHHLDYLVSQVVTIFKR